MGTREHKKLIDNSNLQRAINCALLRGSICSCPELRTQISSQFQLSQ